LTTTRLPGRNAWLILPGCPPFVEFGNFREFNERGRRRIGQAEEYGLDAGETEIAGLDRRCGAAQAAIDAKNDLFGLWFVGEAQDPAESLARTYLGSSPSGRIGADAYEIRRAERNAGLVTAKPASAALDESVGLDRGKIHRWVHLFV
jgi:hypothetical protein